MLMKTELYCEPAGEKRRLHIYLPEGYNRTDTRYPVTYFFDGHNLFRDEDATYGTCWGLMEFLEGWQKDMIVVGVECSHHGNDRLREYCPYHVQGGLLGDLHGTGEETFQWIIHQLKPWVDDHLRTMPFRECTAIAGSSMGGLMSLYGVLRHNRYFSKAACLSSTIAPCLDELRREMARDDLSPDTRVYLSWGSLESRGSVPGRSECVDRYTAHCNWSVHRWLKKKGVTSRLFRQNGGRHCEADWAKQVSQFMNFLWLDGQEG